jgi:hypothetical protein
VQSSRLQPNRMNEGLILLILSAGAALTKRPIYIASSDSGTIQYRSAKLVPDALVRIRRRRMAGAHLKAFNSGAWRKSALIANLAGASAHHAWQACVTTCIRSFSLRVLPGAPLSAKAGRRLAASHSRSVMQAWGYHRSFAGQASPARCLQVWPRPSRSAASWLELKIAWSWFFERNGTLDQADVSRH